MTNILHYTSKQRSLLTLWHSFYNVQEAQQQSSDLVMSKAPYGRQSAHCGATSL